jgi:phosphohistidine phosphatase
MLLAVHRDARPAKMTRREAIAWRNADPPQGAQQSAAMPGGKRLFVLRHAKSSWDDPGLDDHDRPLAPRGRRAASALAAHVRDEGIDPALVLCSAARRTRETLEGVSPPGEWVIEPELYGASADDLLTRLRQVPEEVAAVMVIGHNPALQMLVLRLTSRGDGAHGLLEDVQRKFPTGALATLEFDRAWSAAAPGCATLVSYVRPKQLS